MRRREFIVLLGGAAAGWPLVARAQHPGNVRRLGILMPTFAAAMAANLEAFRRGLWELGYVDGWNLVIEDRYADGKVESLDDLAAELVRLRVEIIVTAGSRAVRACQKATQTIPVVMATSGDAVGSGLVASLARPGGNVTGLSFFGPELSIKYLELIKETLADLARVAVLWDSSVHASAREETRHAAISLGATLLSFEARTRDEYRNAFAAMVEQRADALIVFPVVANYDNSRLIAEFAVKNRLPVIYGYREGVEAGGLMSYGASIPDLFRRAAVFVDKILGGAKPAELPVEQPTMFELVINLRTAHALGITIPESVLIRADVVIE
jgi:putative ABC transport system substrate-binding protein